MFLPVAQFLYSFCCHRTNWHYIFACLLRNFSFSPFNGCEFYLINCYNFCIKKGAWNLVILLNEWMNEWVSEWLSCFFIRILKKQKSIAIECLDTRLSDQKNNNPQVFPKPMFIYGKSVACGQCCILTFFVMFKLKKYNTEEILSSLKVILVNFAENSWRWTVFSHKHSLDNYAHKDSGSPWEIKHYRDWKVSW